ncbi:MAG: hypothetical protein ACREVN_09315 [Gammaproteobacteria bacterium]
MLSPDSDITFLGPQSRQPTVHTVLGADDAPVCVISAGWREREGELEELERLEGMAGRQVEDLRLYRRIDDAFSRDRELFAAHRQRQTRLKQAQRLYRLRLGHALRAARELFASDDGDLLAAERRSAMAALRTLDRHHLRRIRRIHEAFAQRWRPAERDAIAAHVAELKAAIERSSAVLIAGGHVGVLLSRMRLLGVPGLITGRRVVAWSAGAMALAERVVLFHDHPPQGAGDPEVLDAGFGLVRGVVALPHAHARLRLDDERRVALFARRFAPSLCLALEPHTLLRWRNGELVEAQSAGRLHRKGSVQSLAA